MEYYSALTKNKIIPFAATWMQLETLILSKVRQKERVKVKKFSFTIFFKITASLPPVLLWTFWNAQ